MSRLALILSLCAAPVHAQGIITTIAGGGQFQVTGLGGPAIDVPLGQIQGIATDPQGNVYAVDSTNLFVVKIATTGLLTVVAGNGQTVSSGNGGPAIEASFQAPNAIAADASGNLFIADACTVRKIGSDGIISAFAGRGPCGYSGDDGGAVQASLSAVAGIAVDARGNVYLADFRNHRIRKVTPQGIISTVAGNDQCCNTVDGVPATSTSLGGPYGVAADHNGVLYITDSFIDGVLRVGTDGIISTIAGGNGYGYSGDGGPATAAVFHFPNGVALDGAGDIYVGDVFNFRVRRITPDGIIRTIAGTGAAGFTGDQGQASMAALSSPSGIAVDASGNVYFGDSLNLRVRKIDPSGIITTYAGNGDWGFAGEGIQARGAVLGNSEDLVVDAAGNIYISDNGNNRVRKVGPNGVITTVVGSSIKGFAGDGGPAAQALLNGPGALALDSAGNLYIADTRNARVRKVDSNGIITTFAGNGSLPTFGNGNGDGGPAVNASIGQIAGLAFDAKGNLYSVDGYSIRQVSPSGTITTFVTGLSSARGLAVDAVGNAYTSEFFSSLEGPRGADAVRISPDGTITALLSNTNGFGKMAFDSQGNLYVPDIFLSTLIRVSPSGAQTVVAGTGQPGFSGDDGPATLAQLRGPTAVALDSAGNLYIADNGNGRIRKVFLNPASGVFQPTLQTTLQPGYYIATVTLGQGEHPGYWGIQVVAPAGVLAGGFNLGGTIQQRSLPPGFGGIYVPSPEVVHFHVDAQAADGGGDSTVGLAVQLLDASRNPVIGEQFGGTSVDFSQTLPTGYYVVEVRGGNSSPIENFQMGMITGQFAAGAVAGGFANGNTVGFGAFYLTAAQQVTIQVFGQPSYGANGAGGLRLTLLDARRNVIATVP